MECLTNCSNCGKQLVRPDYTSACITVKHSFCDIKCRTEFGRKEVLKEMIGKKFGYLTVVEYVGVNRTGNNMCRVICDCGEEAVFPLTLIKTSRRKKCCKKCDIDKEDKANRRIAKVKIDKKDRITTSVRNFIRELDDGTKQYVDKIAVAYRLKKDDVREILSGKKD